MDLGNAAEHMRHSYINDDVEEGEVLTPTTDRSAMRCFLRGGDPASTETDADRARFI